MARLLAKRHQVLLRRKTVWLILHRRGVWEGAATEKQAVQRFERAKPNELWQIDLIEKEPTAIGDVYTVPILDDHSRYWVGVRFFLTKGAGTTLLTMYLALTENGTATAILGDRGGQFLDATGAGKTHFQELLELLGIRLRIAWQTQTKGEEEHLSVLKQLFAREERRKVFQEATVRYTNRQFRVSADHTGWQVWVANLFDQYIEIRAGSDIIAAFEL